MTLRLVLTTIVLLILISEGRAQFFDFFQGFQPLIQPFTTRRPATKHYLNDGTTRRPKTTTKRSISITYVDGLDRIDHSAETPREKQRKKQTTEALLFNVNFYTTTVKPVRKTVKNNARNSSYVNSRTNKPKNSRITSTGDASEIKYDTNDRWFDKPIQNNNIGNEDYYITNRPDYESTRKPDTTRRPNYTTTRRQTTSKPNYNYYDSSDYNYQPTTKRPYNYHDSNHQNYETTKHDYTTKSPFYSRPGVKPAAVNTNRPPITNKPVTTRPPYKVNSRPTDAGAIAFPDEDASPEIIVGPDEDYMSEVEKRRYIDIAERMCEKYKSLSTKRLQAIPLVPSPQPVNVEVRSCAPTNVPLVVGGKVVQITEFPHMALLGWLKLEDAGYSWKCGGSLLSDQYVLTAAHCAYQERDNTVHTGAPRAVQLGSSYLDDPGALVVKVGAVIRHPKYKQPKSYYDIALVKLASTVTFSEVIRPACLGTLPPVGRPIIATGWGQTEFGDQSHELRSVSLPVWDINDCANVLGTSRKLPGGPSSESQMCAGERKGGKDTCQGDSGGPAQIQDGCVWRVVGVTSLGRSCGAPGTPGLYSVVHKAFIAAQIFGGLKNNRNDSLSSSNNNYNRRNRGEQANNNDDNQNTNDRNVNRQSFNSNRNNDYTSSSNQESNKNHRTNIHDNGNSNEPKYYYENTHRTDSYTNSNLNHRTDNYDSSRTTYDNSKRVTNTNNNGYDTNRRDGVYNYDQNNQSSFNNNYSDRTENNNYNYNKQQNGRTDNYWNGYDTENLNNNPNYNSDTSRQYNSNEGESRQYDRVPWWTK